MTTWTPTSETRLAALETQVPLSEYDPGTLAALERAADPAAVIRIDWLWCRAGRVIG